NGCFGSVGGRVAVQATGVAGQLGTEIAIAPVTVAAFVGSESEIWIIDMAGSGSRLHEIVPCTRAAPWAASSAPLSSVICAAIGGGGGGFVTSTSPRSAGVRVPQCSSKVAWNLST